MRQLLFILLGLTLVHCRTKPYTVNAPAGPGYAYPITASSDGHHVRAEPGVVNESMHAALLSPARAGIGGVLMLQGEMPLPLSGIRLKLFVDKNGQWQELSELQTERGGHFAFTRELEPGSYRLKVEDSRYRGEWPVTLGSQPLTSLILEATRP